MSRCPRILLSMVPSAAALAWVALLGGCASEPSYGSALRRPVMPSMAPSPGIVAPIVVPDREIVEAAVKLARQGNVVGATRTIAAAGDALRRGRLGREAVAVAAAEEPAVAAELAVALPAGLDQIAAVETAALALARSDPQRAIRWAAALTEPTLAAVGRRAVMDEQMRSDPRTAMARVMALASERERDDMAVVAAGALARVDSDAAVAWMQELDATDFKQRVASTVAFELAQANPQRAIALAETLPIGRNRWVLYSAIAQTWVATDPKAALAWARQLPEGEPRDAAFAGADTGLGIPASRRIAIAPGTRGGSSRTRGGGAAVASWNEVQSPAFAAWLASQPPGLSREEAVLEFVRQRAGSEPDAMAQFLDSLSASPIRDRAIEIYHERLLIGSPAMAARWVRSLPRSERSDEMIEKTAKEWMRTNPAAAEDWLLETMLPPERKERLLREFGR